MKIINIKDKNSLKNAAEVLKKGGILVFPTDTVYGIGCILNEKVIRKLYRIKNRPLTQPTAILMTSEIFFKYLKHEQEKIKNILSNYPAGRITMVFQKDSIAIDFPKVLIKNKKIGIRLPKHRWLEDLIDLVGPIVTSSANKKGEPIPESFLEIDKKLLKEVDLLVKNGKTSSGVPSTVYDIETHQVLR